MAIKKSTPNAPRADETKQVFLLRATQNLMDGGKSQLDATKTAEVLWERHVTEQTRIPFTTLKTQSPVNTVNAPPPLRTTSGGGQTSSSQPANSPLPASQANRQSQSSPQQGPTSAPRRGNEEEVYRNKEFGRYQQVQDRYKAASSNRLMMAMNYGMMPFYMGAFGAQDPNRFLGKLYRGGWEKGYFQKTMGQQFEKMFKESGLPQKTLQQAVRTKTLPTADALEAQQILKKTWFPNPIKSSNLRRRAAATEMVEEKIPGRQEMRDSLLYRAGKKGSQYLGQGAEYANMVVPKAFQMLPALNAALSTGRRANEGLHFKKNAADYGGWGTAHRGLNTFNLARGMISGPVMAALPFGVKAGGVTSMLKGGAGALGLSTSAATTAGITAGIAPIIASMFTKHFAMKHKMKVRGIRLHGTDRNKQFDNLPGIDSQLQSLTNAGISPAESAMISLLRGVQLNTGTLGDTNAILHHYVENAQKKDVPTAQDHYEENISGKSGPGGIKGIGRSVSRMMGSIEGGVLKFGAKYNPLHQLGTLLLRGLTPAGERQELNEAFGGRQNAKARDEWIKKEAKKTGISHSALTLMLTPGARIANYAESVQGKQVNLLTGIYDILRHHLRITTNIAVQGHGIKTLSPLPQVPKTKMKWWDHIPGVSGVFNLLGALGKMGMGAVNASKWVVSLPQNLYKGVLGLGRKGFGWAKDKISGPMAQYSKDPSLLAEKALGKKAASTSDIKDKLMTNILPNKLGEITSFQKEQLDVLYNIWEVGKDHLEATTGVSKSYSQKVNSDKEVLDRFTGEMVTEQELDKRVKSREMKIRKTLDKELKFNFFSEAAKSIFSNSMEGGFGDRTIRKAKSWDRKLNKVRRGAIRNLDLVEDQLSGGRKNLNEMELTQAATGTTLNPEMTEKELKRYRAQQNRVFKESNKVTAKAPTKGTFTKNGLLGLWKEQYEHLLGPGRNFRDLLFNGGLIDVNQQIHKDKISDAWNTFGFPQFKPSKFNQIPKSPPRFIPGQSTPPPVPPIPPINNQLPGPGKQTVDVNIVGVDKNIDECLPIKICKESLDNAVNQFSKTTQPKQNMQQLLPPTQTSNVYEATYIPPKGNPRKSQTVDSVTSELNDLQNKSSKASEITDRKDMVKYLKKISEKDTKSGTEKEKEKSGFSLIDLLFKGIGALGSGVMSLIGVLGGVGTAFKAILPLLSRFAPHILAIIGAFKGLNFILDKFKPERRENESDQSFAMRESAFNTSSETAAHLGTTLAVKGANKAMSKIGEVGAKSVGKTVMDEGVKAGAKVAGKSLGKSILKKVPLLGLGVGAYFAYQRLKEGDWLGSILELASGAASTIPGAGTAVSVGIDAALGARDISHALEQSDEVVDKEASKTAPSGPPPEKKSGLDLPVVAKPEQLRYNYRGDYKSGYFSKDVKPGDTPPPTPKQQSSQSGSPITEIPSLGPPSPASSVPFGNIPNIGPNIQPPKGSGIKPIPDIGGGPSPADSAQTIKPAPSKSDAIQASLVGLVRAIDSNIEEINRFIKMSYSSLYKIQTIKEWEQSHSMQKEEQDRAKAVASNPEQQPGMMSQFADWAKGKMSGAVDSVKSAASYIGRKTGLTTPGISDMQNIGSLSEKYESRGNSSAVGYDAKGGASYGSYQIASRTGTMKKFLEFLKDKNPEAYQALSAQQGSMEEKDGAFAQTWKQLAGSGKLGTSEKDFIKSTHYDVAARGLSQKAYEMIGNDPVMQQVLWSRATQLGPAGAARLINGIVDSGVTDKKKLVEAIYDQSINHFGSSPQLHGALASRFSSEKADALAAFDQQAQKGTTQTASASGPSGGPGNVAFPLSQQVMTSPMGHRDIEHGSKEHQGVDFRGAAGDPVMSIADGKVIQSKNGWLVIQHTDGTIAKYGHMPYNQMQPGTEIKKGQQIGVVGNVNTQTPHLHFEVHDSKGAMDPNTYFKQQLGDSYHPQYAFNNAEQRVANASSQFGRQMPTPSGPPAETAQQTPTAPPNVVKGSITTDQQPAATVASNGPPVVRGQVVTGQIPTTAEQSGQVGGPENLSEGMGGMTEAIVGSISDLKSSVEALQFGRLGNVAQDAQSVSSTQSSTAQTDQQNLANQMANPHIVPVPIQSSPMLVNGAQNAVSTEHVHERTIDPVSQKIISQIFANTIISFQQSVKSFALGQNPFTVFK